MAVIKKIILLFVVFSASYLNAQTPGFNYQALILNKTRIQVPGTDVKENQVPLGLEKVVLRFTIRNENGDEYIEEQQVTTDENGLVSLIVGEGTPIKAQFSDIVWDGKLKYFDVDINILKNNNGFVALDSQKILYLPQPSQGTKVYIVNQVGEAKTPYNKGDIIWVKSYGPNNKPTLMIWDGNGWVPVSEDYDATNELGLIVATNVADRDSQLPNPKEGDQVWNKACACLQVYDTTGWTDIGSNDIATNGLTKNGNNIELGGTIIKPTTITASSVNTLAIKGLEPNVLNEQTDLVAIDKATGVLKQVPATALIKEEVVLIIAAAGQNRFDVPLTITDPKKINVYRNGVRIDFTPINTTTIELETGVLCYQEDQIRIVQFN